MLIKVHFYKGKSLLSRLIKFVTGSKYSHVSIETQNGLYEARRKGVHKTIDPTFWHTPGTSYDTIDICVDEKDYRKIEKYLEKQIGKGYDYLAFLFGFIINRKIQNKNKLFCVEYAYKALKQGIYLPTLDYNQTPEDLYKLLQNTSNGLIITTVYMS